MSAAAPILMSVAVSDDDASARQTPITAGEERARDFVLAGLDVCSPFKSTKQGRRSTLDQLSRATRQKTERRVVID
jgi:hypothetical protein